MNKWPYIQIVICWFIGSAVIIGMVLLVIIFSIILKPSKSSASTCFPKSHMEQQHNQALFNNTTDAKHWADETHGSIAVTNDKKTFYVDYISQVAVVDDMFLNCTED